MKNFSEIVTIDRIRDLTATTKEDALAELCALASTAREVTDPKAFLRAIHARETAMSTGIGMGVAIPHAKIPSITGLVMAIGRSKQGIDFDSLDDLPAHIIILMGASDHQNSDFLKLIGKIGALFNQTGLTERFLQAETPEEIFTLLTEME